MQKATQQQTKEHNTGLVLSTIFHHEVISRAEIARITSLTRTTVSDIVAELIAEGLVSEVGIGSSIGGKSPILLGLVEDARYLVGLDLSYEEFRGAIVNLRGAIREKVSLPINHDCTSSKALEAVFSILDRLVASPRRPLVGIGIGTPGLINTREGIVVRAVNLDWNDLPLGRLVQERYHLPVCVLNDSQAAAMAEYSYGAGTQPETNLVAINVRRGIGAGIIINGQLFQGDGGWAGEIGHVVVVPEGGLPCRCGNTGCLETVASGWAVVQRLQAQPARAGDPVDDVTLDSLQQGFQAGDPRVRQVILDSGSYLGLAIAALVGTLNINKVVVTGEMTRFGKPWLAAIRERMGQTAFSTLAQKTQVEISRLSENGILLGASAFMLKDYALLYRRQA